MVNLKKYREQTNMHQRNLIIQERKSIHTYTHTHILIFIFRLPEMGGRITPEEDQRL